jgi:hypothetical protein
VLALDREPDEATEGTSVAAELKAVRWRHEMNIYLIKRQYAAALPGLLFFLLVAFLISACSEENTELENQVNLIVDSYGTINSTLPEKIDPKGRYLFYIHGKIIEDQGVNAVSPQFGTYEFEEILSYLANMGFNVIGEVRSGPTDVNQYAEQVSLQVEILLSAGVPSENITIVGFSKGAYITMLISSELSNPDLNFVLIAICVEEIISNPNFELTGRILSLYETTDEFGSTCKPLADRSPKVMEFEEIRFDTGKQHGAFYTADPIWLDLVISWIFDVPK